MGVVCYCRSCREGSRQIEALPNGSADGGADGGTPYVLYRQDRVGYSRGLHLLRGLEPSAGVPTTKRVVAGCCGSPVFLDFRSGHLLSVYREALLEDPPPAEMRVHTAAGRPGSDLPNDAPS